MNHFWLVLAWHVAFLGGGLGVGVVIMLLRNGWEDLALNVRSRVQRRYVKRVVETDFRKRAAAKMDAKSAPRSPAPTIATVVRSVT
ncbi:hypothetical protein [Anatilimnocola floriformis]|uniref:hypothetical protein n=1 Tax=Anatilimnocola floriformis TaxID=2948575 RepID=UPI0020C4B8D0|nr:hypothetical protein [Anatilimnocola floriformis]